MYNFCVCKSILYMYASPVEGKYPPWGRGLFNFVIFRKNASNYAKLIVEPYVCDNLSHTVKTGFLILRQKRLFLGTSWAQNYLDSKRLKFQKSVSTY